MYETTYVKCPEQTKTQETKIDESLPAAAGQEGQQ